MCSCVQGQASDIAIHAEEFIKLKSLLNKLLAHHTGQPVETIGRRGHIVSFPYHTPGEGHIELEPEDVSFQRAMGPEDVSLLNRCPHSMVHLMCPYIGVFMLELG